MIVMISMSLYENPGDRDMPEGAAHLVPGNAVVVGQLEHRALRLGAVADEGERVLLFGPLGGTQQLHAHDAGVEVDRPLQVADPQHRMQDAHGESLVCGAKGAIVGFFGWVC